MGRKKVEINPVCGKRIKQLCKEKNITQAELAEKINYTPHNLSRVATGKAGMSPGLAYAITQAFPDIQYGWLMGDDDVGMIASETYFINYLKSSERLHAFMDLLQFTDYEIDFKNAYNLEKYGIDELYYDVKYRGDITVALTREQLDNVVDNIIKIIGTYMDGVVQNGEDAEEIKNERLDFVRVYLYQEEAMVANQLENDDEKEELSHYIEMMVKNIDKELASRSVLKFQAFESGKNEDDTAKDLYYKDMKKEEE